MSTEPESNNEQSPSPSSKKPEDEPAPTTPPPAESAGGTGPDAGSASGAAEEAAAAGDRTRSAESTPDAERPAPADQPEEQPLTQPGMKWYVLRVASNKEEQVRDALDKKVKIEALEKRIGRILVPTLKEKRMKAGVAKVFEKKLYPGYVFVEMAPEPDGTIPENVWFLVKETMGVGDFISSDGKPTSMMDHEVAKMLEASLKTDDTPTLSGLDFQKGDRVKIREGSFESYEGDVDTVDAQKGMITVLLTIFGRATPVDVEYWQLEKI